MLDLRTPLDGYAKSFDGVELSEVTDHAIVAIAVPLSGEAALNTALKAAYGCEAPASGHFVSGKKDMRLLSTSPDQMLAIFPHGTPDGEATVAKALKDKGYCTEQTDAWVMLSLSGPRSRQALERLCPLDLDPAKFPVGHAGRTVMEHMSAVIMATGDDSFLLMSASSSAGSFLHAIETSIKNIL